MFSAHESEIHDLIARRGENDGLFWSRKDGNIHAPAGFSTIDVLNVLGELGAEAHAYPELAEAVEFVLGYQAPEGAFRYSRQSSKLPCITGQILAGLGRLGALEDPRCERSFAWLLEKQADDGGWRCATVKLGRSPETDASNPGATLFALDAFRHRLDGAGEDEQQQLDRAVDSLLRHWESRVPLGPCVFGIGSRFLRVEYPFLRYNLFYYVYVLSHYSVAGRDRRFGEAVRELEAHTDAGQMVVEAPHSRWQDCEFAREGKPSTLATARWREVQANLSAP